MFLTSSLFLVTLATPSSLVLPQTAPPPRSSNPDALKETVDDVETLRVLLTRELGKKFDDAIDPALSRAWSRLHPEVAAPSNGGQGAEGDAAESEPEGEAEDEKADPADADGAGETDANLASLATGFYIARGPVKWDGRKAGATSYTRSFYAPGVGAWIDTTLSLSVEARAAGANAKGDGETARDEWDDAKAELKRPNAAQPAAAAEPDVSYAFDLNRQQVDKAVATAVDVLAKYGHRVRNLKGDESVVIALKLEAQNWDGVASEYFRVLTLPRLDSQFASARIPAEITKTVIVRAPRSVLESFAAGDLDKDAFRKRIVITRY